MVPRLASLLRRDPDDSEPSAPPPYEPAAGPFPPVLFSSETTTITTTTTTRTHFFGAPIHWRKRTTSATVAPPPPLPAPSSTMSMSMSMFSPRRTPLLVEKDLPPTPPDADTPTPSEDSHRRPSRLPAPDSGAIPPSHSSAATLAQAVLGIGLTHSMPGPSSSQVSTVAFAAPNGSPVPRRVKSSTKLRATSTTVTPDLPSHPPEERRRTRGLSLGTTAFLNFSPDPKGKAKSPDVDAPSPPRSISRRSSFWTRKKPSNDFGTPQPDNTLLFTPLPSVQPGSPFVIDLTATPASPPPPQPRSAHTRGLSRSKSERLKPAHHAEEPPLTLSPPPPRRTTRPSTADPAFASPARSSFLAAPSALTPHPAASETPPPSFAAQHRPRANTNPALLHRLSLSIFSSSGPSLPQPDQFSSPVASSPIITPRDSPRPSLAKSAPPKPTDDETPENYLERLRTAVSKGEIAGILATSTDTVYVSALHAYFAEFDFKSDPLDVALRRLLMDVGLPRETQQIDRVMEAFAARYVACHPTLFASDDHPYVIAFSLIMLHTDAFNKSNKRKMTKADYVKNTRLPGVPSEVLDCFYDNIVFAPFIFVEDPLEGSGLAGVTSTASPMPPTSSLFGRGNKVDLYYLISNNMLAPLRVDVETHIPPSNPYAWRGVSGTWDDDELRQAFANAVVIPVISEANRSTFFGSPNVAIPDSPAVTGSELLTLRATKMGMLSRKDEVLTGGKRATTKKWKPFNVILTGSHLLFSRDIAWASASASRPPSADGRSLGLNSSFRFDEVLSLRDTIAVADASYTKHPHTFRLVVGDGREFLLQAREDTEVDEWISRINYASAFKSVGIRMRPMGMSGRDVELTGVAAATSHLHDLQHASQATPQVRKWGSRASLDLMGMLSGGDSADTPDIRPSMKRKIAISEDSIDSVPVAPEIEGADQFKATFDQVKADLAAGRWGNEGLTVTVDFDTQLASFTDSGSSSSLSETSLPSRLHIIQARIHDLDAKVSTIQTQLDIDLRFIRNMAILTPFQRQTRDRLVLAVQGISKRIMQERLEIVKLSCYRTVLAQDLSAEGRDWSRTKQIALKAATATLQSQLPRDTSIPKMTVSFHDEANRSSSPLAVETPSSTHRPESTTDSSSFHSALDFDPEFENAEAPPSPILDSGVFDSPAALPSTSASYPFPETTGEVQESLSKSDLDVVAPSPRTSDELQSHEKFYTAHETSEEQVAEEWNKTRCAQRVSLVRLPSTLGIRFARGPGSLV